MSRLRAAVSASVATVIVIAVVVALGLGVILATGNGATTTVCCTTVIGSTSTWTPVTTFYEGCNDSTPPTGEISCTTSSQEYGVSTSATTIWTSSTSASGLQLDLSVAPSNGTAGALVINVEEFNLLNTENNVSMASNWVYPQASLNPYDNCGAPGPVGFAIFRGYYDLQNVSSASALALYNTTWAFTCTTNYAGNYGYSFKPQSDFAWFTNSGKLLYNDTVDLSFLAKGYFAGGFGTGSAAELNSFPSGNYTILGADEWGKAVVVHMSTSSGAWSSGTSTDTTGTASFVYTTSSINLGPTNISDAWDPALVANLTMYSPEVQSYVRGAYSYDISGLGMSQFDTINVIINVTGSQIVSGNWTSGYHVVYTGMRTLNASVMFTPPNSYQLLGVISTSLPDQNDTITFSSQQQRAIQVALSNATVQRLMGSSKYYVSSVTPFPVTNGTYANDYFLMLNQISGTKIVGVFVDASLTAVVGVYNDTRVSTMCYGPENVCFTSPWGS